MTNIYDKFSIGQEVTAVYNNSRKVTGIIYDLSDEFNKVWISTEGYEHLNNNDLDMFECTADTAEVAVIEKVEEVKEEKQIEKSQSITFELEHIEPELEWNEEELWETLSPYATAVLTLSVEDEDTQEMIGNYLKSKGINVLYDSCEYYEMDLEYNENEDGDYKSWKTKVNRIVGQLKRKYK